jgi:hypothetical protein
VESPAAPGPVAGGASSPDGLRGHLFAMPHGLLQGGPNKITRTVGTYLVIFPYNYI